MPTSRGNVAAGGAAVVLARRWPGLAMLVPGAPQWLWRQRERAILLGGSYAAALGVGAFAWGTAVGAALLAFAYAVHVASAADAIGAVGLPGLRPPGADGRGRAWRWRRRSTGRSPCSVPWSPGPAPSRTGRGRASPSTAWPTEAGPAARPRASTSGSPRAPASAAAGSRGSWRGRARRSPGRRGRLEVDGRRLPLAPFHPGEEPKALAFTVPDGHLLVAYRTDDPLAPRSWELVAGRPRRGPGLGPALPGLGAPTP